MSLDRYLTDFILMLQFAFMFTFSSIGGVVANEALMRIKNHNHKKWNNITARIILALFVCYIVHGAYTLKKYEPKWESFVLALAGFMHYPIGVYLRRDFLPMLGRWAIDLLKGGKKDG